MTITAWRYEMNISGSITLGIGIAGFVSGIIWKVSDLSVKFGRINKTLESNDERDAEERRRNAAKFTELYNDRNRHESTIARLDTSMGNIEHKLEKVDSKLDRNEESVTKLEAIMQTVLDCISRIDVRLNKLTDRGGSV